jgi:hypothetical protein
MYIWFWRSFKKLNFTPNWKVCELHQFKMEFLGYVLSRYDIRRDPCKVQTIIDWVTPTFIQDV